MSYSTTRTTDHLSVTFSDGSSITANKSSFLFPSLLDALDRNVPDDELRAVVHHGSVVKTWSKGRFLLSDDNSTLTDANGRPVHASLVKRILTMISEGASPTPVFHFWDKLQANPSHRSVTLLWDFLSHESLPIGPNGDIIAYKGVNTDLTDAHTGRIPNDVGNVIKVPRNMVSDDPKEACHQGLHIGALDYAKGFAKQVIVVSVSPADVVCIPYDANSQKMRCCAYRVLGRWNQQAHPDAFMDVLMTPAVKTYMVIVDQNADGKKLLVTKVSTDAPECPVDLKEDHAGHAEVTEHTDVVDVTDVDPNLLERLFSMTVDELRSHARGMHIVGANKIPGGRFALMEVILSNVRTNQKKRR